VREVTSTPAVTAAIYRAAVCTAADFTVILSHESRLLMNTNIWALVACVVFLSLLHVGVHFALRDIKRRLKSLEDKR